MRVIILNIVAPVLSLLASAGLGLAGLELTGLQNWLWLDGPWGFVVTCVAILLAAGGLAPLLNLLDRVAVESELITSIKRSLVPAATRLMSAVRRPADFSEVEKDITAVLHNLRSFIGNTGTDADANLYALKLKGEGKLGTQLVRLHPSDTDARETFTKTKGSGPRQVEESAAVDRVLAGEYAYCPNVRKRRHRRILKIADQRPSRQYVAFMSVPIMHENRPIGMLSVNAISKNVIQKSHREYLEAVAKLLSVYHEACSFESMIRDREALKGR